MCKFNVSLKLKFIFTVFTQANTLDNKLASY